VAGALICADCMIAAAPAQAAPRPYPVVKVAPAAQLAPGHYPAAMNDQGWPGLLPIGGLDNHDLPEPEAPVYASGIFAGTAVTGTAARG
jgi:hypothetical protein